jgi:HlyD family secretion protein
MEGEPPHIVSTPEESDRNNRPTVRALFERLRGQFSRIALVLFVVLGAALVSYRYAFAPISVRSHEVARGQLIEEVMGTGTLEARTKVTVSTKISGRISAVLVDQGDRVTTGQVLVRLDDSDLRHQVEVEEANVAARKATVDRLIADKAYGGAALDLATLSHTRAKRLSGQRVVSEEDLDRAVEALRTARAAMDKAEAALVEGEKELVAAEKTLQFHQARLEDTVIIAPFDGLIVRRDRDPGDIIVPGSSALALVSLKEVWVTAWVDETQMARLEPAQVARVVFRSEPGSSYQGEVVRVAREVDRETRELLVDVLPRSLPANWAVGQRAEVYVEIGRSNDVVLLPTLWLVRRAGEPGAFVAEGGRARWRKLSLGRQGREAVEVVEGLRPGEAVVTPAGVGAAPLTDARRIDMP